MTVYQRAAQYLFNLLAKKSEPPVATFARGLIDVNNNVVGSIGAPAGSASGVLTLNAAAGTEISEIVTATNVILAAESGTTYYLNSATEFVSTLPLPALGLAFSFIVKAAPSGASYTVVTSASANIIKGVQFSAAGDAGDTGTADDTVTFVDGAAVAGDRVDFKCDGTNWFAYAFTRVATGVTFTTAS